MLSGHFAGTIKLITPRLVMILSDWDWQDPLNDCTFGFNHGFEIRAANGRDLWDVNFSAPRLLRQVRENFTVQTVCLPLDKKPAIGGLLLWKDQGNYLRLDRGRRGSQEISFEGCLKNKDIIIGRGRLSTGRSKRVYLRVEWVGDQVNALCSADGEHWFTLGHAIFPAGDPVQVGLHAIGNIPRHIYHGAYPDGTAILFETFWLWEQA